MVGLHKIGGRNWVRERATAPGISGQSGIEIWCVKDGECLRFGVGLRCREKLTERRDI